MPRGGTNLNVNTLGASEGYFFGGVLHFLFSIAGTLLFPNLLTSIIILGAIVCLKKRSAQNCIGYVMLNFEFWP